jgi:aminomethyltransferase
VRRTPFYQFHADHGAKFVEFAGYEMPIMYRSIIEEHHQVRNSGGLFDVSHMGRFKISGRHARRLLDRTVTRRIADMKDKTCRYGLVCNERGGVMDDVIVYKFEYHYLLVVNASNRDKILAHLQKVAADGNLGVKIEDQTDSTAMVALQGPKVMEEIGKFSSEVPTLKRYAFCEKNLLVLKMLISRTGYTGEDGVEVVMNAGMAAKAIKLLIKTEAAEGKTIAIAPAGLGARDTLRIEAAMPLYGHELSEDIDPLSAGLNFAVSLDKADDERGEPFIGMEALKKIQAEGLKQKRIGLKLEGKRTARQHMKVLKGDKAIGEVTSGCLSPTLGYPIAMAFIDAQAADTGDRLTIELGSSRAEAQVVALPFYKRG